MATKVDVGSLGAILDTLKQHSEVRGPLESGVVMDLQHPEDAALGLAH